MRLVLTSGWTQREIASDLRIDLSTLVRWIVITGAEMARLYNISQPTVSRIVAQHRMGSP